MPPSLDSVAAANGPGANSKALGKVLIIDEGNIDCSPDDAADGGIIILSFQIAMALLWP